MASRPFGDDKPHKKAFIVLVNGKLAPGNMEKLITAFKPLAAHVAEKEDGCLAYELSVKADDPNALIIYERYISKEYFDEVHVKSEPFSAFMEQVKGIEGLELDISTYVEHGIGF